MDAGRGSRLLRLASWRNALTLIGAVTLARVLYLALLCPYELAADEAQYWDWSRRLDLSYYSKGPGVAWAIRASTELFGHAEWAIRVPAALSMGVAMLAVAAMARRMSALGERAAFLAAVTFLLVPAYHVTAILMTIDAPYIACWAVAAWAWWEIERHERAGRALWAALGAALGVGFLFKYTILLLIPGMVGLAYATRSHGRRGWPAGAAIATAVFLACVSPVILWNQRHGWPTLSHLLGHLGAPGGDVPDAPGDEERTYTPLWTLEFLGTQLGVVGPALIAMALATLGLRRSHDAQERAAARCCLWLALPVLAFYLLVSFVTDVEGNWPIAAYVTLCASTGVYAARVLAGRAARAFRVAWDWAVGYGGVAAAGALSLSLLSKAPLIGGLIPYHRLSGYAQYAREVAQSRDDAGATEAFIVTDRYTRTALLAYYLPGRPAVRSAASFMGSRRSSYDLFPDTSLRDPALLGRDVVLVGTRPEKWMDAFVFESVEPLKPAALRRPAVYLGRGFGGPREARPDKGTNGS